MNLSIGIDYSSYEAVLVALPLDGPLSRLERATVKFRDARDSGDDAMVSALGLVRPAILNGLLLVGARISSLHPADVVWIERGFGQSRRADFTLGCYFGAIYAVCSERVWTNPLDLREWKRTVTKAAGIGLTAKSEGNGNAKKEVANEACRALLELGEVDGSEWTPDELDAFGVAYTGRLLNRNALTPA